MYLYKKRYKEQYLASNSKLIQNKNELNEK